MSKYRIIEENHPAYGIVYKAQIEHRFLFWKSWGTLTETDCCTDGLMITEDKKFTTPNKAEEYILIHSGVKSPIKVIKEITI